MTLIILCMAVLTLAYANGANDNFKGVATLFGSGTTSLKSAITWATVTTLLGSLAAVLFASKLLQNFSGKGLVADELVKNADYASAVALAAAATVLFATRLGMPISTTHALVGSLVGAGWAAGSPVNISKLTGIFFLPLLASPLLALAATRLAYPVLRRIRLQLGITEESCVCVGSEVIDVVPVGCEALAVARVEQLSLSVGDTVSCRRRYHGRLLGIEASSMLDRFHFLSAGTVSFARGLNDTPKIAAPLLVSPLVNDVFGLSAIGLLIAAGGMLSVRRVAATLSQITGMNHGQGFTSNLITSVIVIGASPLGLPVSTTHVSCGSLFGIGTISGQANWGKIAQIVAAWLTTLPLGLACGALAFWLIGRF